MGERIPDSVASITDRQLAQKIDEAKSGKVTTEEFWLAEADRRSAEEHRSTIRGLTWVIAVMTFVMMLATAVNVYLFSQTG